MLAAFRLEPRSQPPSAAIGPSPSVDSPIPVPTFPSRITTLEEAVRIVQDHGRANGYAMVVRRSKKDKSGAVVTACYLECDRHSTWKVSQSQGMRNRRSRQMGCPYRIVLRRRREDAYEVEESKHPHNHPPSNDQKSHRRRALASTVRNAANLDPAADDASPSDAAAADASGALDAAGGTRVGRVDMDALQNTLSQINDRLGQLDGVHARLSQLDGVTVRLNQMDQMDARIRSIENSLEHMRTDVNAIQRVVARMSVSNAACSVANQS